MLTSPANKYHLRDTSAGGLTESDKRLQTLRPNGDDPTPLYLQVARKLGDAINAGQWRAEEALPPERELSEKLGVSRVTARKALDVLVDQKLIVRRQGSGTFIATHIEEPLHRLTNFTELLKHKGFESSSRWVERKLDAPTYEEVLKLGVSPGSQVARASSGCGSPTAWSWPSRGAPCPSHTFPIREQSKVLSMLTWTLEVRASFARFNTSVRSTPRRNSLRWVGIKTGDAILVVTRVGFTKENVAIELYRYVLPE